MCLNWLKHKICKAKIPEPQNLTVIDLNEITTILKAAFPDALLLFSDKKYKTTSITELTRYLKHDLTDQNKYVSEYYDCDDFSYRLMGNISNPLWGALPFGILWVETNEGYAHAVNVFIDDNRLVWVVEPQTDNVFKPPESWRAYVVMM